MKKRSQSEIDTRLRREVHENQFGTVRVYTRRHINGCTLTDPDQQYCQCPKHIYLRPKRGEAVRKSAGTPSFTEACGIALKFLREFDPEIANARKINEPVLGPTVEDVVTHYLRAMRSKKLVDTYLRTLASYFERQREFTANGKRQRAKTLNPSLLDFLARHNETAAVPVTRLEQLQANLLDDWAASWRSNDLTSRNWRVSATSLFRWAAGKGHALHSTLLQRMLAKSARQPLLGENVRIKKGNRCGYFPDDHYARLIAALAFCTPKNISPSQCYPERMRAFLEAGRWGGMAIADIVLFSPALNLDADNVLTYRRRKNGQTAGPIVLDPAVARRLRSIPPEPGSSSDQPFRFPGLNDHASEGRWRDRFGALCGRAGITEVTTEIGTTLPPHPHMLRDTFAINAISSGVALEHVSKMLGHATTEITEKAYLFWVDKRLQYCIADQRAALARRAEFTTATEAANQEGTAGRPTTLLQ